MWKGAASVSSNRASGDVTSAYRSGRRGKHKTQRPVLFRISFRAPALTLACGLVVGAGLASQLAAPPQAAAPPGQAGAQSSVVSAPSNASVSFNRAAAIFTHPQDGTQPPIAFPNTPAGSPQMGMAVNGNLAGVVEYAYAGLGRPYVWGGTSFFTGWDCSGFVQWAYRHAGIELPRVSQWEGLTPTTTPSPGDLVTQRPDGPNHWAHVGIYVGDGMMISALNPDAGTVLHSVGPSGTSWFFTTTAGSADAPSNPIAGGPFGDYPATPPPPAPVTTPAPQPPATIRPAAPQQEDGVTKSKSPRPAAENGPADSNSTKPTKPAKTTETTDRDQPSAPSEPAKPGKTQRPSEPTKDPKPGKTADPTGNPTADPTGNPTSEPTDEQTAKPSDGPTTDAGQDAPATKSPTGTPDDESSGAPTGTDSSADAPQPPDGTTKTPSTPEETGSTESTAPAAGTLQDAITTAAVNLSGQLHNPVSFIEAVLAAAGYATADGERDYSELGKTVTAGEAVAGDLLYYIDDKGTAFAAIYLGDGFAVRSDGGIAVKYEVSEGPASPVFIRLTGAVPVQS